MGQERICLCGDPISEHHTFEEFEDTECTKCACAEFIERSDDDEDEAITEDEQRFRTFGADPVGGLR